MSPPTLINFARTAATLDFSRLPTIQLRGRVATIEGISYVLLTKTRQETVRRYLRWEKATVTNFHAI